MQQRQAGRAAGKPLKNGTQWCVRAGRWSRLTFPGRVNSFNNLEMEYKTRTASQPLVRAVETVLSGVRCCNMCCNVLRRYHHQTSICVSGGKEMADIMTKTKMLKCPGFKRGSSHTTQTPQTAIFLPFPKRNVISAGIKTKAKTNLFWGNFQLFTCQTELLKTADSSWHSQMQTNYRRTLQLERAKTKTKYSNTITDSEPVFRASFNQSQHCRFSGINVFTSCSSEAEK